MDIACFCPKLFATKRRVNSKDELRRLFQNSSQFRVDELPTKAGIDKLDRLRFRDFLHKHYTHEYPEKPEALLRLRQNMNLATETGVLNLAGVLMFKELPEWIVPQFVVKAIRYPGNKIHSSDYVDTEDFSGPLRTIFESSHAFMIPFTGSFCQKRNIETKGTRRRLTWRPNLTTYLRHL